MIARFWNCRPAACCSHGVHGGAEPAAARVQRDPGVTAKFLPVSAYDPGLKEGIVLLDRFTPPSPPKIESIWIEPPHKTRQSRCSRRRAR